MNQHDQMREALQAIETVLADAYHRHFAECCGRGQGGCCGDFIEQWTPEDHKILDTLSPIQRKLSQALASEPAPLVRLTASQLLDAYMQGRENHGSNVRQAIHISGLEAVQNAIINAMTQKQGNTNE